MQGFPVIPDAIFLYLRENLVVLEVNNRIDAEMFADLSDGFRSGGERVNNVLTSLEVSGLIGEFAATFVGRIGDLSSKFRHFLGDELDEFFNGGFRLLHVENDKGFVVFHDI